MNKYPIYIYMTLVIAILWGGWAYLDLSSEYTRALGVITPIILWLAIVIEYQEKRISKLEKQINDK